LVARLSAKRPLTPLAYLPGNVDSIVGIAAQVEARVGVKRNISRGLPLCIRGRAFGRLELPAPGLVHRLQAARCAGRDTAGCLQYVTYVVQDRWIPRYLLVYQLDKIVDISISDYDISIIF
jgi:hypothetical protein